MLVHALRGCGAGPGLPHRRRGALDRDERRLGDRGVARGRGRRVRPLVARARRRGRGADERRARPPRDVRARGATSRRRSASSCAPAEHGGLGPPGAAGAAPATAARGLAVRRRLRSWRRAARVHARRRRGRAGRPGRPQRAQRRRRADRVRARRRRAAAAAALATSAAPAGASSASAPRPRARWSSTTTPTTRPRCAPRSRRRARSTPRRVVAVFQPHLFSRTKHSARGFGAALAIADVAVVTDVYPARERAEDFPGVDRPAGRGGRRRRRPAGSASRGCRTSTTPSASCAPSCARATCWSRSARATSTRWAGGWPVRVEPPEGEEAPRRGGRGRLRARGRLVLAPRLALVRGARRLRHRPELGRGARRSARRSSRRARHDDAARPRGPAARGRRAYPSVAGLETDAEFPHKLTSRCASAPPVAAIESGGRKVAAAGDGRVLRGMKSSGLPTLRVRRARRRARDRPPDAGALAVAGGAPPELRGRIERLGPASAA